MLLDREQMKTLLGLHLLFLLYSSSGIFGKLAAGQPFLSSRFCLYYLIVILIFGIYAIAWQQIIKRVPLTTAFANKAVTIVWGLVWGTVFFNEPITRGKVVGVFLVVVGVILFSSDERKESSE